MTTDLVKEFLEDYLKQVPNLPETNPEDKPYVTTKQDLINILTSVELNIRWNKGKPIEKIIDALVRDNIDRFETIRKKYGVPGYTASIKVGNINVKLYGGNINYLGEPMPENALFDIASMTKFYTQIIAYNLINEGVFNRSDKVKDLDDFSEISEKILEKENELYLTRKQYMILSMVAVAFVDLGIISIES